MAFLDETGLAELWSLIKEEDKKFDYKIGDTLTTARTDLGHNWLLCDGSFINGDEYPTLGETIGKTKTKPEVWDGVVSLTATSKTIRDICCHDGVFVMIANDGLNNLSNATDLLYSFDGGTTWTKSTTTIPYPMARIKYINDMWVAFGNYSVYTATDPTGKWTGYTQTATNAFINDVIYADGKWVFVGHKGAHATVFTANSLTENWTTVATVWGTSNSGAFAICYHNGTWVMAFTYYDSSEYDNYPGIAISTNLTSWSVVYKGTLNMGYDYSDMSRHNYAEYINGEFVVIFDCQATTFVAASVDSKTWEIRYPDVGTYLSSCSFADDRIVIFGRRTPAGLCHSSDNFKTYTKVNIQNMLYTSASTNPVPQAGAYNNGSWFVISTVRNYNTSDDKNTYLPTISQDPLYTYIKAKEA